jgi:hypothetical protein
MFLVFGINQREKQLGFNQLTACKCCGRYGRVSAWMRYTYFMLFFIPLFKWNRRYYLKMDCCGAFCEINPTLGRDIETGRISSVDINNFDFCCGVYTRRCSNCGFETQADFRYCPNCGTRF